MRSRQTHSVPSAFCLLLPNNACQATGTLSVTEQQCEGHLGRLLCLVVPHPCCALQVELLALRRLSMA
jgi:hypothetical protein